MDRKKALRAVVTALTLALCAALCLSVLKLYGEGMARRAALSSSAEPVFTREGVADQLRLVAPVAGLWAVSVLAAAIAGARAPARPRAAADSERMRDLLRAFAAETPEAALREERARRRLRAVLGAALTLCVIWALVWLLNGTAFADADPEAAMGALTRRLLPPVAIAFAALMGEAWLGESSLRREIAALKGARRAAERRAAPVPALREGSGRAVLRLVLIGAAAALLVLGVSNGGLRDVLVKAVNICTECIGLG